MNILFIRRPEELRPHLAALTKQTVLAVDTETTGLDPHCCRMRLLQITAEHLPVFVIDCFTFLPDGHNLLKEILSTKAVKIFQNAKFDLQFLEAVSLKAAPLFDTMIAARLLRSSGGPARAGLRELVRHYLSMELDKELQLSDWSAPSLSDGQIAYAAKDAHILPALRERMKRELLANGLGQLAEIEFRCTAALAHMEYGGIHLDAEKWRRLTEETEREKKKSLEGLYPFSGKPAVQTMLWGDGLVLNRNFDSNVYVLSLLNRHGIPVKGTSRQELHPYRAHPLVQALSAYRKTGKALSSFLYPLPRMLHPQTGRLHPRYEQVSAGSGRMSCHNPNIQQIPRAAAFRGCFTAPQGKSLIIADYSQIELRVAAQFSKDARMLEAYRKGEDLHRLTASLMLNKPMESVTKYERQSAKAVNFGLIFGMGAPGLQQYAQQSYGVEMTLEEAETFHKRFFQAYRGIRDWHRAQKENPPQEGRTLAGRKFSFTPETGLPGLCNPPVQGTAADIAKKALGRLAEKLEGTDSRIVATVHDEILVECGRQRAEETAALLKSVMEEASDSLLPLVPAGVDLAAAQSWAGK